MILSFLPQPGRCKDLQGQPPRDRGRTLGTTCTCKEEHTLTERQSWGPSNDSGHEIGKLGITIQDPPRVWKTDTFIVIYLFVFYSVPCLRTWYFTACFNSVKWRLLLLLLRKKWSSSFVWNSQGAVFYSHRSEWLWFASPKWVTVVCWLSSHLLLFSKEKIFWKEKAVSPRSHPAS